MSHRPVITLLTDFGTADPYVGTMKGVIAGICSDANVIDISHDVPPQDIRTAAFFLERSFRYFPRGAVHLAVVDPGVGTSRAPLALRAEGHLFVGPDNGVLSLAARRGPAVILRRGSYLLAQRSNTFHGRDVFAPAAAHLACGVSLEELGPRQSSIVRLAWPKPKATARGYRAEIVSVDRFGNLVTSLEPAHWQSLRRPQLEAGPVSLATLSKSYRAARKGELVLVFGGYGLLEIAARDDSAAAALGIGQGHSVQLVELARRRR
ncbi:MAG TPA: SAM-dependent chlorinase/fluorinase [Polyangiaceae bacterium]